MNKINKFHNVVEDYHRNGYVVAKIHDELESERLKYFATSWIKRLLIDSLPIDTPGYELENYHLWEREISQDHRKAFNSKNRYVYPPADVMDALLNTNMKDLLSELGTRNYKIWDDGWGNVGFRMIRPGVGDGYPLCTKEWGVAKGVISFWIPIIGFSSDETLELIPGSHLQDYEREVVEGQFAAGEPRFVGDRDSLNLERPILRQGDVICYSSKTLHSEDVCMSSITRINLEIRFQPNES
jgi:hypothetical protein